MVMLYLSPRQRRFYQDTCSVWRPVTNLDAVTSAGDPDSYELVGHGFRFHLHLSPSTDDPGVAGRLERDLIFTLDLGHFPEKMDIDADYVLKVTSLDRHGNPTENNGRYWKVRGHPKAYSAFRTRPHFGKKSVLMSNLPQEEVPEGVL
jgi:hypothetical protein